MPLLKWVLLIPYSFWIGIISVVILRFILTTNFYDQDTSLIELSRNDIDSLELLASPIVFPGTFIYYGAKYIEHFRVTVSFVLTTVFWLFICLSYYFLPHTADSPHPFNQWFWSAPYWHLSIAGTLLGLYFANRNSSFSRAQVRERLKKFRQYKVKIE